MKMYENERFLGIQIKITLYTFRTKKYVLDRIARARKSFRIVHW